MTTATITTDINIGPFKIPSNGQNMIMNNYAERNNLVCTDTRTFTDGGTSMAGFDTVSLFAKWATQSHNYDFDDIEICCGVVSGTPFDAQIDDVVIFDETISPFAVETLYDSGNHRAPSELVAPIQDGGANYT